MNRTLSLAVAGGSAAVLLAAMAATPIVATASPLASSTAQVTHDVTDPAEAARMDAVDIPTLNWEECGGPNQLCVNLNVPLRYDQPKGETRRISVLKNPARKPTERIGTLFVNPGGPGGSAMRLAAMPDNSLPPAVLDRFDIVGVEPRGLGASERVECFNGEYEKRAIGDAWTSLDMPSTPQQIARKKTLSAQYAQACMTTGAPMSNSISTTNHVRDIELVRRAMKEDTISIFGFSYGTAIAQYYGNMFPEHARALAGDGVLDAVKWVGSADAPTPLDQRLRSSVNSKAAVEKILELCVEPAMACKFYSDTITPQNKFVELVKRVKAKPVPAVLWGGKKILIDENTLYTGMAELLYGVNAPTAVTSFLEQVWQLSDKPSPAVRDHALRELSTLDDVAGIKQVPTRQGERNNYDNSKDAYLSVICTDGVHPQTFDDYAATAEKSKATAAGFGPYWTWSTSVCARENWTGSDPLKYTGPFTKRSLNSMLFIGNDWDPATPREMAESAAAHTPGSGLVTTDGFGHTTSTTSSCTARVLSDYLVKLKMPAQPVRCTSDVRSFSTKTQAEGGHQSAWPQF